MGTDIVSTVYLVSTRFAALFTQAKPSAVLPGSRNQTLLKLGFKYDICAINSNLS